MQGQDGGGRRSGSRTCLCIGLLVAVCCCVLPVGFGWLALNRAFGLRDSVGWIDSERRKLPPLQPLPVPADNAADTYDAAIAALPSGREPDSLSEWLVALGTKDTTTADACVPEVRDYVGECAAALAEVHEAASKDYVSPAEPDVDQPKPWLARYRRLARVTAARAYLAHRDGDDTSALAAVEDGYALGVKTPRGGGAMERLVGVACVSMAQRPSTEIMLAGRVPPDLLRAHAVRVRELRSSTWPISSSWHFDATATMRELDEMAARGVRQTDFVRAESGYELTPPSTIEATQYRLMTAGIPKTREWVEDRLSRCIGELGKPHSLSGSRFRELMNRTEDDMRSRQDRLAQWIVPVGFWSTDRWAQMLVYLEADETIACLEADKKEKGSYPATLGELVPAYMPELPEDPWTGKPLIYRLTPERYALYAAGPNGADDGGVTEGHGSMEPDLVIVPVPPPRQPAGP